MTRLPIPGKDSGTWGDILNDYLSQSHASDGSLKDNVVGSAQLQAASVGASQLQDNAVGATQLQAGAITESHLPDSISQDKISGLTDALSGKADALGPDDNYVTDAEKVKLANLSGTNTGDQDLSGLVPKTTTVAGKALTGNITLAASDLTDHTEATQDVVGAMVEQAGGSYDDAAGTITLPGGGLTTVDWVTLTQSAQAITLPAPTQSVQLVVVLTQDSTGGRSASWPASVVWEGGAVPSVPAGPGERAVFTLLGTDSTWLGWAHATDAQGTLADGAAQKAANLSDLASAATARTNLGLGGAAVLNVGTTGGTVAAGDDGRIVNAVRHRGNRFAVIGTSIEEGGCLIVGQTADFRIGDGWFPLACFLTHQRMMLHRAAGVSGNTSAQMLARFAADIAAYDPDWCVFGAPTNDYTTDTSWVQAKINMQAMWDAADAADIGIIVCTMLPRTGTNPIPIDKVIAYNAWVKAQAAANRWHVFDLFAAAVDPATGGFLSGYTSDGVHPVDVGAHAIATAVAAYFTANILPTLAAPREPDLALVNADATNLVASNACLTVDAGPDGIPDGWTLSLNGSSTTAVSLVDVAGVPGKMFQMDTTVAGTTRQYGFTLTAPTVGTKIRVQARIELEGQSSGSKVSLLLNYTGLSGYNLRPMLEWSHADASGVVSIEGTVPTGATGAVLYLNRSAGTGKVRLGQPTVRVVE